MLEIPIQIRNNPNRPHEIADEIADEGVFVTGKVPEGNSEGKLVLEIVPNFRDEHKVRLLRVQIRVGTGNLDSPWVVATVSPDFWPMLRAYVKLRGADLPKGSVIDFSDF